MNCALHPNANISGSPIRGALYLQALLTFALKTDHSTSLPLDILVTNLAVQLTALYLIIAAYLDETIDIPHSVIASYFVFMLSACRNSSFDFSAEFLQSRKGRQTLLCLWATDMVFRPLMLAFNYSIWVTFRNMQTGRLCPRGSGSIFMFGVFDVSVENGATLAALIICGVDVVGEVLRYMGEITRCQVLGHRPRDLVDELVFDSRVWWISTIMAVRFPPNWNRICWYAVRVSYCYSVVLCLWLLISVEKTISVNQFGGTDGVWGLGQVFVILDTLALVIFVSCRKHLRGMDRHWSSLTSLVRVPPFLRRLFCGTISIGLSVVVVWWGAILIWAPILLFLANVYPRFGGGLGDFILITITVYAVLFIALCLTCLLLYFRIPLHFYRWLDLGVLFVCEKVTQGWEYIWFRVQRGPAVVTSSVS